jgi:hypothetical protein
MRSPVDQRGYSLLVHEPKGILPFGPDQRGCSPSPRPRSRELPTGMTRIEQLWPKHGSRSAATLERPRRGMLSMAPCFGRPSHAPKSRACHRHRKCVTFSETSTAPQEASCVLPAETSKYINDRINGVTHFRPRAEEAGATYGARLPWAGRGGQIGQPPPPLSAIATSPWHSVGDTMSHQCRDIVAVRGGRPGGHACMRVG